MTFLRRGQRSQDDGATPAPLGRHARPLYALRRLLSASREELRFRLLSVHDRLVLWGARYRGSRQDTLVLRTDGLGDLILWLDAAKELPRVPALSGRFVLMTCTPNHELNELAQFADVWAIEKNRFSKDLAYRRMILRKVSGRGFAVVFNALLSRDPLVDDAVARATAAPRRIAAAGDFANARPHRQRVTNRWYTALYPAPRSDRMELQRSRDFLSLLGADYSARAPRLTGSYRNPTDRAARSYYVLFPGAGFPGKGWRPDRWRELALRIFHETGLPGLVCGGMGERAIADSVLQCGAPLESWVGKTTVPEFAGIVQDARFVVTNDSSAAHLAAALAIPAVTIVGGGHFGRFLPYAADVPAPFAPVPVYVKMACFNCAWSCVFPRRRNDVFPCIDAISVDQVWRALQPIIQSASPEWHRTVLSASTGSPPRPRSSASTEIERSG